MQPIDYLCDGDLLAVYDDPGQMMLPMGGANDATPS